MPFQTSCSSVLSKPESHRLSEACALLLIEAITDTKCNGISDIAAVKAKRKLPGRGPALTEVQCKGNPSRAERRRIGAGGRSKVQRSSSHGP